MKHIYSLAALLLFMLPASAQQEGRVITEEPLCLVSADSVSSGQSGKQLFILHTSDTHSRMNPSAPRLPTSMPGWAVWCAVPVL